MKHKKKLILTLLLAFLFLFIFRAYYQRIGAFGCFDDCFNIVAGYFITKGKILYSEIFFNHQPLMAYISAILQNLFAPDTLYKLIFYHRAFVLFFSLIIDIILIFRFRWIGVGFVLLYESTKFYVFGDRFLAESLIVYPLVYLVSLSWYKLKKKDVFPIEYFIVAIFSWFVIFMREPFIPLVLVLSFVIVFNNPLSRVKLAAILLFVLLSIATLGILPFRDFFFNVVTVNSQVEVKPEALTVINLLRMLAYPFDIFVSGENTLFRQILIGIDIIFVIAIFLTLKRGQIKAVLFILAILGLANIRAVPPGSVFYEAFHMTPWYGMFIMVTLLLLSDITNLQKRLAKLLILTLAIQFIYSVFSPQSFLREKINKDEEFTINYGHYFVQGEVIRTLADKEDSLFVDGFDELIHWTANLPSSYPYSWYTSVMPYFDKYRDAREEMFKNSPPDFYYGSCPNDKNAQRLLPKEAESNYVRLYFAGRPTCLHVYKTKLGKIPKEKWNEIKKYEFYLPNF